MGKTLSIKVSSSLYMDLVYEHIHKFAVSSIFTRQEFIVTSSGHEARVFAPGQDQLFRPVHRLNGIANLNCVCAIDETKIAAGANDGRIPLWNIHPNGIRHNRNFLEGHIGSVLSISTLNGAGNSNLFCTSSTDQTIKIWTPRLRPALATFRLNRVVTTCKWANTDIYAGLGADVYCFDVERMAENFRMEHDQPVNCFDVSGHVVAIGYGRDYVGSRTGQVNVFDDRMASKVLVSTNSHKYDIISLMWKPDNDNYLVTGDSYGFLKIWDYRTMMEPVQTGLGYEDHVVKGFLPRLVVSSYHSG